jgi:hypothetical protein
MIVSAFSAPWAIVSQPVQRFYGPQMVILHTRFKLAVRRPTWRRSLRVKRVLSAEFTGNPRPMRDKSLSAHAIL